MRRTLVLVAALLLSCDARPPTSERVRLGLTHRSGHLAPTAPPLDPALPASLGEARSGLRLVGESDSALLLTQGPAPPGWSPSAAFAPQGWTAFERPLAAGRTLELEIDGVGYAVTAGLIPDAADQRVLDVAPDVCGDRHFPARVAGGLASCSTPGLVDRWNEREVPPTPVAAASAAGWSLALGGRRAGSWSPAGARVSPQASAELVAPPGVGGDRIAVAGADRVLVGVAGTGSRSVIGARPRPGQPVAVSAEWLAWIDRAGLILRRRSPAALALWPDTTDPGWPVLSDGWLTWVEAEQIRGLGLHNQGRWSVPVNAGFTDGHGSVDDWRLVPDRSGARLRILAVHLPTGAGVVAWEEAEAHLRLRGADASGLTAERRLDDGRRLLAERTVRLRILEEDGAAASSPLRSVPGGHGGRQGVLAPGEEVSRTIPAGPAGRLSVWLPRPGRGSIQISAGSLRRTLLIDNELGWFSLGRVGEGLPVTVRWRAGASELAVDALRVEVDR